MRDIGTDTQENYTQTEYNTAGGNDLSGFGLGSPQYQWLEKNLASAKSEGKLIFVQFHHIPFSSGEHGVPIDHELSTGQVGVPVRILNPLFENYGVIAVLAGHDELFERSYVDADGDGKGVLYYDVGVAGDGMRGVKRNWSAVSYPPLNYNSFSKWTADQNSTEIWDNSGNNPVLLDGGKHYGHLEINIKKIQEGDKSFAQIDFEPVYAFPVMNTQYQLQRVERRVYTDPVRIMVELKITDTPVLPQFKTSIQVELTSQGTAETMPSDYLSNTVQPDWSFTFSRNTLFTCSDLGLKEILVTVKNAQNQEWSSKVTVEVEDNIAPDFEATDAFLAFDKVIGKVIIDPESFYIRQEFITENCLDNGGVSIDFDKKELTCADLTGDPILVKITLTDRSGNATSKIRKVTLNPIESKKVSVNPVDSYQGILGETVEIKLGEEFEFVVDSWIKDGQIITGETGKTLLATQSGTYWARVKPTGGCLVETKLVTLTLLPKPYGPLKPTVELDLNSSGKATLSPSQVFVTWPQSNTSLSFTLSQTEFTCQDIGEREVNLTIKNQTCQTWTEKVKVLVRDREAPVLIVKNLELDFDVQKGFVELMPEDFINSLTDNCSIKQLTISRNEATCEDLGKEIPILVRAEDDQGNISEVNAILILKRIENQRVDLKGVAQFCEGEKGSLELSSTAAFEVVRWKRNGVEIPGQVGKTLEVTESGKYQAVIRYVGGFISESSDFEVTVNPKPTGEISIGGNILRAPEGNFTYQWFRNGEKIIGANSQLLTVDQMGDYFVELTSSFGCISRLKPVTMTISGLGNPWVIIPKELKIYPNPASSRVFVEVPEDSAVDLPVVQIFSLDGKELTEAVQLIKISSFWLELDISSLSSGTYLVWIQGDSQNTYFGKIILLK